MDQTNRYDGIDPVIIGTIRFHARQLHRARAIPGMETVDYEQDLMLDVLRRLPRHDPSRAGISTFIDRVVRNRSASLFAAGRARAPSVDRTMVSLDEPLDDTGGGTRLADLIGEQSALWSEARPSGHELAEIRHDLRRFLSGLSPALRRCCGWLLADSIQAAAHDAGVHRSSIYDALSRLRRKAQVAGLEIYLHPYPTVSEFGR